MSRQTHPSGKPVENPSNLAAKKLILAGTILLAGGLSLSLLSGDADGKPRVRQVGARIPELTFAEEPDHERGVGPSVGTTRSDQPVPRPPGTLRADMIEVFQDGPGSPLVLVSNLTETMLLEDWMEKAQEERRPIPGTLFLEHRDDETLVRRYRLHIDGSIEGTLTWQYLDGRWRLSKIIPAPSRAIVPRTPVGAAPRPGDR